MNIILTGFMGTGKSVAGRKLVRRLDWPFVDLDEQIEKSVGAMDRVSGETNGVR